MITSPLPDVVCAEPGRPSPAGHTRLLVIGYGNTLFSDDGVGPYIAEQVASWQQTGVRALAVPLLVPELSPLLAAVDLAVFVDAALDGTDRPQLEPLTPAPSSAGLGHTSTPESLLALAEAIFGRCPPAWILRVPAADFSLGQTFSAPARAGAGRALCQLRHLGRGTAKRDEKSPT